MKITILIVMMLICIESISQTAPIQPVPTTDEEYNYATIGYAEAVAKGFDVKKGYLITQMGDRVDTENSSFDFKLFIREEKNEIAGIIVIAKNKIWGNVYNICIPINNKELTKKYYNDLNKWTKPMLLDYSLYTSIQMAHMLSGIVEMKKNQK